MSADDKCLDKVRVQNGIKLHPPRMPSLVGTRMKNVGGGQGRLLSTRFRISRNRQAFDQRGGFSCWSTLIVAFVFGLIFGCRENTQPTAGDQPGSNASTKDLATTSEPSSSVVEQKKQVAPAQITPLQNLDKPQTDNTTPIGNSNSDNLSSEDELPFEARRRLPDDRPDINEARLNAVGIRIYRGNRLVLLTDIPDESISQLPAMADRLFEKLESHFVALPVSLDGSDFQVTGCLISDEDRFRSAGLMPQEGFTFKHGRHFNYQFWVFDPTFEYYRRHLVFHEFTHCFITCESGMLNIPALWYIEGMAEYFGTHRRSESGDIDFGILPENFNDYDGWGRISELRRSFQQQPDDLPSTMDAPENLRTADLLSIPTLRSVMPDAVANFQEDSQYVTAWALCWLLHTHPEYKQLSSILRSLRTRSEFAKAAGRLRDDNQPKFSIDWLLTYECLIEGFDTERSFPVHSD